MGCTDIHGTHGSCPEAEQPPAQAQGFSSPFYHLSPHHQPPSCYGTACVHGSHAESRYPVAVHWKAAMGPRASHRHHCWHPSASNEKLMVRLLGWWWGGRGWVGVKLAVGPPTIASSHPLPAAPATPQQPAGW